MKPINWGRGSDMSSLDRGARQPNGPKRSSCRVERWRTWSRSRRIVQTMSTSQATRPSSEARHEARGNHPAAMSPPVEMTVRSRCSPATIATRGCRDVFVHPRRRISNRRIRALTRKLGRRAVSAFPPALLRADARMAGVRAGGAPAAPSPGPGSSTPA